MRSKVAREEALARAKGELLGDDIDVRLHALEREQKINAFVRGDQGDEGSRRVIVCGFWLSIKRRFARRLLKLPLKVDSHRTGSRPFELS
jgi:hypothetical protein